MDLKKDTGSMLASLVPSALLLLLVYSQDKRGRGELRFVVLTFAAGMFAAAVAFFVFQLMEFVPVYRPLVMGVSEEDVENAAFVLGVVGPIEEFLKLLAVVMTACRLGTLNEPGEGILYSSASALGFAAAENWYAMWATGGPDLGRMAVVPFIHMLFSSFFGWGLGKGLLEGRTSPVYTGLFLAAAYHGLYDFLEYKGGMWHYLTLPIVAVLWYFLTRTARELSVSSAEGSGRACREDGPRA